MQLDKPNIVAKRKCAVSDNVRNYCRGNWGKLIIQSTFCFFTVASFIFIVTGAIRRSPNHPPSQYDRVPRCFVSNCSVVCSQAPHYEQHEDEIVRSVVTAGVQCSRLSLTLNRPEFINSSLPENWLSLTRANIVELNIVGGNLRQIKADAFMSKFTKNIRTLALEDITIEDWGPNMLVGLVRLKELTIKDCKIENIQRNSLRAVDKTLQQLSMRTSGAFDPTNITGSSDLVQLHDVDLSTNDFGRILNRGSFRELRQCKILRLTGSRILAIRPGTFDSLLNIDMLFLNNNQLATVPVGLFDSLTTRPLSRIDLHQNLWRCDCELEHIRRLSVKGILMINPVCHYPKKKEGKLFSEFENFCKMDLEESNTEETYPFIQQTDPKETVYMTGACDSRTRMTRILSPLPGANCSSSSILDMDSYSLSHLTKHAKIISPELRSTFFVISSIVSMLEISLNSSQRNYGVMWYNTKCPIEVNCVDSLSVLRLRLYNVEFDQIYTFCPLYVTGDVNSDSCIIFNSTAVATLDSSGSLTLRVTMFMFAAVFAAGGLGAIALYMVIRHNPTLLKGSKRVVIVKHKTAEALILPPKIPLRDHLVRYSVTDQNKERVFVVPAGSRELLSPMDSLSRSVSIRSANSNSPSYVSAIQPTEEELLEWRLRQHFNSQLSVISTSGSPVPMSWMFDHDSMHNPLQLNYDVCDLK